MAGEVDRANDLYTQGKLDDSLKLYQEALGQDEASPVVNYDLGTALYKKGDYSKALGYLQQAANDKSVKIKPKAEYNLANALYKSGAMKENTDIGQAIKSMREALGHYTQALSIDPKDQDAVYNQNFVKKEIERLKRKQQRQQQQQQQNNQEQQQQNQKQQQKNQQQNQQSQQNQAGQQQQNRQKQEGRQNQENQQGQKPQQAQPKQQGNSQPASQKNQQAGGQPNVQELDRRQAEDLLEDYQENEEPKKLLNYMPRKIDTRPVDKDW